MSSRPHLFTSRCAARTAIALLVAASACAHPSTPRNTSPVAYAQWMRLNFALARTERLTPLAASRATAYAAVALYEGTVIGSDSLRSLGGQLRDLPLLPKPPAGAPVDWFIVSIAAHSRALSKLYSGAQPATQGRIAALADSQITARIKDGVPEDVALRSRSYADTLASAIIAWADRDGFRETRVLAYHPPKGDPYWVPTATTGQQAVHSLSKGSEVAYIDNPTGALDPGAASDRTLIFNRPRLTAGGQLVAENPTRAVEPHWGELRPFVLQDGDECAAPPPPAYSRDPKSAYYRELQDFADTAHALTAAQRETAFFWADNAGQSGTPAEHWVNIMALLSDQQHLTAERTAEMFARGSLAVGDAFIGCWRGKYRTNTVRPVTVMRRLFDSTWTPPVVTPAFPEYPSGHSVQSAAVAEVLTAMFGNIPFRDETQSMLGHDARTFPNFRAASEEAARSRLYGGIHFQSAITNGLAQGRCIGGRIVARVHTRLGA